MLLFLGLLASFPLWFFLKKFVWGQGCFDIYKKKNKKRSCQCGIRTRQLVEVVRVIWAAHDTSSDIQKYPTAVLDEVLQGSTSSWPVYVVISAATRRRLNLFFSTLFSLFSTHPPKVQKCPKLLYYLNFGPHIFYCSVFALNYFYDFFLISSFIILFYFILFLC
jgi:hypothetical protein